MLSHHFFSLLIMIFREQNPQDRPTFTEVVDELLVLEREIPEARFSDVRRLNKFIGLQSLAIINPYFTRYIDNQRFCRRHLGWHGVRKKINLCTNCSIVTIPIINLCSVVLLNAYSHLMIAQLNRCIHIVECTIVDRFYCYMYPNNYYNKPYWEEVNRSNMQ